QHLDHPDREHANAGTASGFGELAGADDVDDRGGLGRATLAISYNRRLSGLADFRPWAWPWPWPTPPVPRSGLAPTAQLAAGADGAPGPRCARPGAPQHTRKSLGGRASCHGRPTTPSARWRDDGPARSTLTHRNEPCPAWFELDVGESSVSHRCMLGGASF